MTTTYTDAYVTHYRADYEEGYNQPAPSWTHDAWYMAYCPLCEKDGWGK